LAASFKAILRHSSYLFGSKLLSRLLYTVFLLFSAYRLGPSLFGALMFTLAVVELMSSVGDLGMTRYGARELVRHWDDRAVLSGEIFFFQTLTSLIFCLGGAAVVLIANPQSPKLQILLMGMFAIFMSGFVNTAESLFIASKNFFFSALLTFINRAVFILLGFVFLEMGYSVIAVMAGYIAGVALESALRTWVAWRRISALSFKFTFRQFWRMVLAVIPFMVGGTAAIVTIYVSVIVLGLLKDDATVGVYSAAFSLYVPLMWVPVILAKTLFPVMTERYIGDPDRARMLSWQWYRLLALAGIPLAIMVTLLAIPVLSYFPSGYAESSKILMILVWSVPFSLVAVVEINVLQITDRERIAARALILMALVTTVLCLVLIPFFGAVGAAVAVLSGTIIREAQLYYEVSMRFLERHAAVLFIKPAIGGIIMAAIALLLGRYNIWIATSLGLVAYLAVIFASGGVKPGELKALIRS
jgi:O-antigen/teichoic acid export membrane protein